MRVSEIRVVDLGDACELQARVESDIDPDGDDDPEHDEIGFDPFVLWFQYPADCRPFLDVGRGDPFLATLLVPAVALGERLRIEAPISPRLHAALPDLMAIATAFDPSHAQTVGQGPTRDGAALPSAFPAAPGRTTRREGPDDAGAGVALFFSLGVDSFYSLLKNQRDHPDLADEEALTHLVYVHGGDVAHDEWDPRPPPAVLANAERVAAESGLALLPVATNARRVTEPLVGWEMAHGGALAAVVLALGDRFRRVTISASTTYDRLYPWGTHPVLDPLWSTEATTFVHDGLECGRIDKTRLVAESSLALETLRVCPGYGPGYNCGECLKCLPAMIDLLQSGVLDQCRTLPHEIDVERLREVLRAHQDHLHLPNYKRRLELTNASVGPPGLRDALAEFVAAKEASLGQVEPMPRRRSRLAAWWRRHRG